MMLQDCHRAAVFSRAPAGPFGWRGAGQPGGCAAMDPLSQLPVQETDALVPVELCGTFRRWIGRSMRPWE